jgi:transposase
MQINHAADTAADVLRLSMDAKATVKVGPFARGGKTRAHVAAADHDFQPLATVTPVGIFLPTLEELFVYGVTSKVTSDCLVDRLSQWWESVRERFAAITTLVINLDNGPENHSRRTQFMQRMVDFVQHYHLTVRLAYYPPYHSKYNPIERCWGILENHWNGTLLDSLDTVLEFTRTMTWNGKHPVVELVTTLYQTGVTLTQDAMETVEAQLKRLPALGKWFVDIVAPSLARRDT